MKKQRKSGLIRFRIDYENVPIEKAEFNDPKEIDNIVKRVKKKLGY